MNRTVFLVTFSIIIVSAFVGVAIDAVDARNPQDRNALRSARCFDDTYLRESIATLKQQGGADVAKVSESLLTKSRTADGCRIQLVQVLINNMAQATDPKANQ